MTFDPFGDFDARGYLRNLAQEKDPAIVRRLEHASFTTGIDDAFAALQKKKALTYADVLTTHKTLFEAMYPWAGQDRLQTAPDIAVSRGGVLFAHPNSIQNAIEYALKLGNDSKTMREKPGEVMGYLAYGHPFLDGNGRTIMVVHSTLAQRAGFSIDWAATDKTAYLQALTKELDDPGQGILDNYLEPYARPAVSDLKEHIVAAKGLDGGRGETDAIRGSNDDPAIQAEYKQQQLKRHSE
ncbi:cell filamentation protein [Bradyrhizobium macuxiense]|uniref:protein adenylyltransferase n=1 Tax=Bradyrhizobium macuxiense TaxID=1755647 RepID=A0A560LYW8_9BRAD|nr:Fic family protein [Bradyrhizobium macuxiense]TWC00654.1 cell filamentation protein [Bradyrhizobium macuxiense]